MVLRDVEPSRPGSSRLTQVPTESMDLREAMLLESFEWSRDHRKKSLLEVFSAKLFREL